MMGKRGRRVVVWLIGTAVTMFATSGCVLEFASTDDPLVTYNYDADDPAIATVASTEGVLQVRDGCLTLLKPDTSQAYTVVWPDDARWNSDDKTVTYDGTLYRLGDTTSLPGAIWGATNAKPDFVRGPDSDCSEDLYVVG